MNKLWNTLCVFAIVLSTSALNGAPVIINGNFDTDASGWIVDSGHSGWTPQLGPDGVVGVLFVNHLPGFIPSAYQDIQDLEPGVTYVITGFFKTLFLWFNGPSIRFSLDGVVVLQEGFERAVDWTPFSIQFTAAETQVRFMIETQIGGDSDYMVDMIFIDEASNVEQRLDDAEARLDDAETRIVTAETRLDLVEQQIAELQAWRQLITDAFNAHIRDDDDGDDDDEDDDDENEITSN